MQKGGGMSNFATFWLVRAGYAGQQQQRLCCLLLYSWSNNNNITVVVDNIIPKHTIAMARTCKGAGRPPKGKEAQQERGAPDSDFDDQLNDDKALAFLSGDSKGSLPFGEHGWLELSQLLAF